MHYPRAILGSGDPPPLSSITHNQCGQPLVKTDPDGSEDQYFYFPKASPSSGEPGQGPGNVGYLAAVVKDTTTSDNSNGQAEAIIRF